MAAAHPIRVLVVDDHALFRKAVIQLLCGAPDLVRAGEAGSGLEAIQQATALRPDVILLDLRMPEMDGLEATRRIKAVHPDARIVILTASTSDESLFDALRCGAQGYLLKDVDPEIFFQTVRAVARGEVSLPAPLAAKVLAEFARPAGRAPENGAGPVLDPHELEVLAFLAHGKTNKEIATALGVAERTIKNHVKYLLEKLRLENRVQAATYAVRTGLAEPPPRKNG